MNSQPIKTIDIVPKDVYVEMEFSTFAIASLLDFFEKAMPLYAKVYLDSPIDDSLRMADIFNNELKSVVKTIKEGTDRNDS